MGGCQGWEILLHPRPFAPGLESAPSCLGPIRIHACLRGRARQCVEHHHSSFFVTQSGLIADGFVAAVTALGDAVQASFGAGSDVGSKTNLSGPCSTFEVVVQATPALSSFDSVVLIESLDAGQFIVEYSLDIQGADGIWISNITTAGGKTVGEKLIDILPVGVGAGGGAVRFKCVNAIGGPSTKVLSDCF